MADEPTVRGWLPPQAPGGQPPPRFEPAPADPDPARDGSTEPDPPRHESTEPDPPTAASEWQPPTAARGSEPAGSAAWRAPDGAGPAGSAAWRAPDGAGPAGSAGWQAPDGAGPAGSAGWQAPDGAGPAGLAGWQAPGGSQPAASAAWQAPDGSQPAASADPTARYWGPPPDAAAEGTVTAPAPAGGLAITSVVLGSLGLALLVLSLGTSFLLSLPCSAIGWACGAKARRRADADPAAGRRGTAQTGVVLGMVGVGLGVVSAITWIVLISAGITIDDLRDYLERKLREQRRERSGTGLLAGVRAALGVLLGR